MDLYSKVKKIENQINTLWSIIYITSEGQKRAKVVKTEIMAKIWKRNLEKNKNKVEELKCINCKSENYEEKLEEIKDSNVEELKKEIEKGGFKNV